MDCFGTYLYSCPHLSCNLCSLLRSGLLGYLLYTYPYLYCEDVQSAAELTAWVHSSPTSHLLCNLFSKCHKIDCLGTYFIQVHTWNKTLFQTSREQVHFTRPHLWLKPCSTYYSNLLQNYKELLQHHSVLQSTAAVLLYTTPVLLQYYSVLQNTTSVLQSTSYYKIPLPYHKILYRIRKIYVVTVLLCTTPVLQNSTPYHKKDSVLLSTTSHSTPVPHCTTPLPQRKPSTLRYARSIKYYPIILEYYKVLLRASKYYASTSLQFATKRPAQNNSKFATESIIQKMAPKWCHALQSEGVRV